MSVAPDPAPVTRSGPLALVSIAGGSGPLALVSIAGGLLIHWLNIANVLVASSPHLAEFQLRATLHVDGAGRHCAFYGTFGSAQLLTQAVEPVGMLPARRAHTQAARRGHQAIQTNVGVNVPVRGSQHESCLHALPRLCMLSSCRGAVRMGMYLFMDTHACCPRCGRSAAAPKVVLARGATAAVARTRRMPRRGQGYWLQRARSSPHKQEREQTTVCTANV